MLQPPQAPLPPESGTSSDSGVQSRGISRLPNAIAIAIAVVALAVAAGAWFRPLPKPEAPAAKTYTEQEVAEAKKAVCEAFETARETLATTGGKTSEDYAEAFVVAVNTRLALETTSNFLARTLEENHPTPSDLATPVGELSRSYEGIALAQLNESPQSEINLIASTSDAAVARITQACR